ERLASNMRMSHALLLNVIGRGGEPHGGGRGGDAFAEVRALVEDNHEPRARQRELARQALAMYRTLRTAGIVEQTGDGIRLTVEVQPNFALNQPLSPFALAVIELLDPESPGYALDVLSVIEATLDD